MSIQNSKFQTPALSGGIEASSSNQKSKIGYGDYLRFRDLILERSGLYFPEKKRVDLELGLLKALPEAPLAAANGSYDLDSYYNLLCDGDNPTGRAEMSRLINILTIGETHFFRDEPQFAALVNQVLPALIARKRQAAAAVGPGIKPQLRLWSAGCATGEEPYSLAILLKELLPDLENWHILILATDINENSLVRAQEAIYSDWSFREARAKTLLPRYFSQIPQGRSRSDSSSHTQGPNRYQLRPDIRQMVRFASLNLIEDNYPALHNNTVSMDLIFCRNVTIYFTQEITRQVVKRFYAALNQDGWLVVGHSEPSLVTFRDFQGCLFPNTLLYRKTGQPASWPHDWELMDNNGSPSASTCLVPDGKPVSGSNGTSSPFPLSFTILPSPPSPAEVDPYQTATILLNQGQIEQAIAKLQDKLADEPNYVLAHSLLGRAYANLGRWVEARQWCQSALALDSLQPQAYYVLALVYQHEEKIELAIAMLKKAIYLNRDTPLAHFNLAMLYKKAGQVNDAYRSFQNVIRILEKRPPAEIVPDSGGATVQHLLEIARRMLHKSELRDEEKQ
ncbi:MAG: CheR family methyltransferase [Chloroflexota bacterium]